MIEATSCGGVVIFRGKILLLYKNYKNKYEGWVLPKGTVEEGEEYKETAIREVKEETGLDIENPQLCGSKQFQDNDDARYVVLFYKTNRFRGELTSSEEGKVFWIPRNELKNYRLSVDFLDMVKIFESDELSEFYYYKENDDWHFKIL